MGLELLNNFAEGLYCDSTNTAYEFQTDVCAENDNGIADRGNDDVKHSLKSKVMERLKNRGLDNITADFTPKPSYPMTKEEIEKDRRRKQSNRKSAQRCREKQKQEDDMNRKLLVHLKEEQSQLVNKVNESEEEKNELLFQLKQILPECYIQEALSKIIHATNKKETPRSRMESRHSNEKETSSRKIQVGMSDFNDALVPKELIFTENSIFEENCPEGEFFLSSIHTVSEDERHLNGIVDFLEVGNEETIQLFESNFISVENTDIQQNVFKDQQCFKLV